MGWVSRFAIILLISFVVPLASEATPPVAKKPSVIKRCQRYLTQKATSRLRVTKPWVFDAEAEQRFERIFADPQLTQEQKLRALFDDLVQVRVGERNAVTRLLMHFAAKDALKQKSIYRWTLGGLISAMMGPHYNPVLNRTSIPLIRGPNKEIKPENLLIVFHELQHALDRNSNPIPFLVLLKTLPMELGMIFPTPISALARYRTESTALGAQWELMHRVPEPVREHFLAIFRARQAEIETYDRAVELTEELQKALRKNRKKILAGGAAELFADKKLAKFSALPEVRELIEDPRTLPDLRAKLSKSALDLRLRKLRTRWERIYLKLNIATLEKAGLDKAAFLAEIEKVHGYSLRRIITLHNSYTDGMFTPFRHALLFTTTLAIISYLLSETDDLDDLANSVPAADIELLIRAVSALHQAMAAEP